MRIGLIAAVVLAAAVPAHAQTLTLEPGGTATLTASATGTFTIAAQGSGGQLMPHDRAFLKRMETAVPDENNMVSGKRLPGDPDPPPPPVVRDQVAIRFVVSGSETILSVENGLDQGLVYRARIWRTSRPEPTDVCLVMPRNRIYEHWPYAIARIELTAFSLRAWSYGDPVPCA